MGYVDLRGAVRVEPERTHIVGQSQFGTQKLLTDRFAVPILYTLPREHRGKRTHRSRHGSCTKSFSSTMEKQERKITLLDLLNELQAEGPHSEQALVSLVLKLIFGSLLLGGLLMLLASVRARLRTLPYDPYTEIQR